MSVYVNADFCIFILNLIFRFSVLRFSIVWLSGFLTFRYFSLFTEHLLLIPQPASRG